MIKRTLYFGNPAYLFTELEQLKIKRVDEEKTYQIPIEDIGIVIIDHPQITLTQSVIAKLLENNAALISCNKTHHPTGMMLNLDGHTKQSKLFKHQLEANKPLKKGLWQITIKQKIKNQAALLKRINQENNYLLTLEKEVKSGDLTNCEAKAAGFYWKKYFVRLNEGAITRERFGAPPNNLLNYGYAILRAIIARNLVGSGLLPTLGIYHRNQYNAYCLADDIMEPYRPFVDACVLEIVRKELIINELTPEIKKQILKIPVMDVKIGNKIRPLTVAAQQTTASLSQAFKEKECCVKYPTFYAQPV